MKNKDIAVVSGGRKYMFRMGVKKELNFYSSITAVITEIKSPGRLCQEKYQELASELRWPGCKYYKECSDDFFKEKWWSFACVNCAHCEKNLNY